MYSRDRLAKMTCIFKKMPFILVCVIILISLLDPFIPYEAKQAVYATSLTIKSTISFLLPVLVFGMMFRSCVLFASGASRVIFTILACVCVSNFTATFLSHYIGGIVYSIDFPSIAPSLRSGLVPLWSFYLPNIVSNDVALFSGVVVGISLSKFSPSVAQKATRSIDAAMQPIIRGINILIPVFVAGFFIKMQADGVLKMVISDYLYLFLIIAITQLAYISLAYFAVCKFHFAQAFHAFSNMIPAAISGFVTTCSVSSMPPTISGAEKNAQNKDLARCVIPATVNIHMIGDCFAVPLLTYAVLKTYGHAEPTVAKHLVFTFYFMIAKFSAVGLPGGSMFVMLPILQQHFGFSSEMISLVIGLYMLIDPIATCSNVLGNGAFAKMIDNIIGKKILSKF